PLCCRLKLHFYAKLFSHRATGKFGIFDSYSSVYWIGSVFFCTKSGRRGRQLFVIRHFIIVEIGPMAAAHFAGLRDKYLGFRCAPPQALL
ncbi:MAG TPA: hypothetical protein VFV58_31720, partial [Blastocatellia bacterium]|nr:hypothetical protein [Blastocatellia bacterium]